MTKALPLLLLVLGAPLLASACCNTVEAVGCFAWPDGESAPCPTREEALASQLADYDAVVSDGTFWPAHEYTVDGEVTMIAAECCYDVQAEQCTTELH